MEHKLYKKDTNMDVEHSRVKVTYERPAEVLGLIDIDTDINTAKEDSSEDVNRSQSSANKYVVGGNENKFEQYSVENELDSDKKHRKRHTKRWQQKVQKLKEILDGKFIHDLNSLHQEIRMQILIFCLIHKLSMK